MVLFIGLLSRGQAQGVAFPLEWGHFLSPWGEDENEQCSFRLSEGKPWKLAMYRLGVRDISCGMDMIYFGRLPFRTSICTTEF